MYAPLRLLIWCEQLVHDRDGYAVNLASISDELTEQQQRYDEIERFGYDHSLDVSLSYYLNKLTLDLLLS